MNELRSIGMIGRKVSLVGVVIALAWSMQAQTEKRVPLDSTEGLHPYRVKIAPVMHQGRKAIHVTENAEDEFRGHAMAVIEGTEMLDGTIEVEVAAQPAEGAPPGSRGFAGVAFHVPADASSLECFYLRPTNGRADDQLRRNHSTQYISFPGYPWHRLREESPGVYESYVDLVPGEWTKVRIEVEGVKAKLYVHDAPQPVLIVNDLKLGSRKGLVALWIGQGTEAWFRNLTVTRK